MTENDRETDDRVPHDRETDDRVARALLDLMRWSNRMDVRRQIWALQGAELSPTELGLMVALEEHGPIRLTDLAASQGVDRSTLSPQIRRLEKMDLVGRTTDPRDARATPLELTDLGRATAQDLSSSASSMLEKRLTRWSAADRTTLADLLDRLVADLYADAPAALPRSGSAA